MPILPDFPTQPLVTSTAKTHPPNEPISVGKFTSAAHIQVGKALGILTFLEPSADTRADGWGKKPLYHDETEKNKAREVQVDYCAPVRRQPHPKTTHMNGKVLNISEVGKKR